MLFFQNRFKLKNCKLAKTQKSIWTASISVDSAICLWNDRPRESSLTARWILYHILIFFSWNCRIITVYCFLEWYRIEFEYEDQKISEIHTFEIWDKLIIKNSSKWHFTSDVWFLVIKGKINIYMSNSKILIRNYKI